MLPVEHRVKKKINNKELKKVRNCLEFNLLKIKFELLFNQLNLKQMKKLMIPVLLAALAMGTSSCIKSYSCDCTIKGVTTPGNGGSGSSIGLLKSYLKTVCDQAQANFRATEDSVAVCVLK